MPLCITRVMWSALPTNENEASGAWIDVPHMLMGETMGTKQADINLSILLRAGLMGTFLYFPLAPWAVPQMPSCSGSYQRVRGVWQPGPTPFPQLHYLNMSVITAQALLPCQSPQEQGCWWGNANFLVLNPGFAFPGAVGWGGWRERAGPLCSPDGELWFISEGYHCYLFRNLPYYYFHWEKLIS